MANNETIQKINNYIEANGLSVPKIAKEAGMKPIKLWLKAGETAIPGQHYWNGNQNNPEAL